MSERSAKPLVLASNSPRRRMLLDEAGLVFEVHPPNVAETLRPSEEAPDAVARLAREKALSVAGQLGASELRVVLGADTIVVIDDSILGKPRDAEHAERMLARLCGRTHRVITGVAVARSDTMEVRELQVESWVAMRTAPPAEIRAYVATGEPLDKAGAYAVQGEGRRFVSRVDGSETNVIGLPVEETLALLRSEGIGNENG